MSMNGTVVCAASLSISVYVNFMYWLWLDVGSDLAGDSVEIWGLFNDTSVLEKKLN